MVAIRAWIEKVLEGIPAKQVGAFIAVILTLVTSSLSLVKSNQASEDAYEATLVADTLSAVADSLMATTISYELLQAVSDSLVRRIRRLEREVKIQRTEIINIRAILIQQRSERLNHVPKKKPGPMKRIFGWILPGR